MTRGVRRAPRTWASRLPVSAVCRHATIEAAVPTASTNPMGWAAADATNLPRAASANAVVMPQLGHGSDMPWIHPQGAMPSPRCVPTPVGDGVSHAATPSTASAAAASTAQVQRSPLEARNGAATGGSAGTGG